MRSRPLSDARMPSPTSPRAEVPDTPATPSRAPLGSETTISKDLVPLANDSHSNAELASAWLRIPFVASMLARSNGFRDAINRWLQRPLEVTLAALVCVVLYRIGVLPEASMPVLLVALATVAMTGKIAQNHLAARLRQRELYTWIGVRVAAMTVAIYASGWGPILAVGSVLLAAEILQAAGARAAMPTSLWAFAAILTGQLSIAFGPAPSTIASPLAHLVAAVGAIASAFAIRIIAVNAAEKDRALEQLRHAVLRLDALHSLGQQVLSRLQVADMVDLATQQAQSLLHPCTALLVLGGGDGPLRYASAHGEHARLFRGRQLRPR